jgi:S-DNA-T family DNA segregation ATPase FtsK/SpoIIIE
MAKKPAPENPGHHGRKDVAGIILLFGAILLLIALFSYDPNDRPENHVPPNRIIHNHAGPFGAWLAYEVLFVFGLAAYTLPFLMMLVGLGCFFERVAFLRRRAAWTVVLFACCMGLFDLYHNTFSGLHNRLNVMPGGALGTNMNLYCFNNFGMAGATIVFLMLIFISALYLTNFHLGGWIRAVADRPAREESPKGGATLEREAALEKRKRELERELKETAEKGAETAPANTGNSGLGADGKPVPEPQVRDLSVPQAKAVPAGKGKKASAPEPAKEIAPPDEGIVIPAQEVAAATTADILGRKPEPASKTAEPKENDSKPAPEIEDHKSESHPETAVEAAAAVPGADAPVVKPKPAPRKPKPITVASTPLIGNYKLPPMEFLQHPDTTVKPTESKEELMANARLMQQTLAQFDIEVSLGDITKGPTITRYELHPAPGVKLEKIAGLSNNIAAALKAERINILAPVPGKSSVGVEVPNAVKTKVIMRDLLESEEWTTTKARIPLALGKDVYGHPIIADLAEMPHLLIAGSTGSGKSVCINSIIASLLYKFSPDQLRFVMIDPKVVELQQYNALPHLVVPVVTDPKKVILALRWVVNEMEKRYQIFAKVGVRNIKSFNDRPKNKPVPQQEPELPLMVKKEKLEPGADGFAVEVDEEIVVPREDDIVIPEKLSYIVVIIDELADLMLVAPADVEMAIARITQMARAAGIHCIVATQRPSVDVITGVIKANIPARIAFQVAAKVDSRTILDAMGADKLLGKGDMLYLPPGSAKLIRAQGALITDQEIQACVDFIAHQGKPSYELEIHKQLSKPAASFGDESGIDEDEDIIQQCIEVIRSEQKASVSLMQRRLRLGYTRAARIMDELENRGIVGPSKGAEPRDILIDLDEGGADGGGEPSHGK